MSIKITVFVLCIFLSMGASAQSADSVYNKYLDFNLARFDGDEDKLLTLGEDLLPHAKELPEKARINFYFAVGKMYEDDNQPDNAISYYEKVATAVPDYYVAHRALGYLYLGKANDIETKVNAASDQTTKEQLRMAYVSMVRKALSHLEKAQACDPSDETFQIIKDLYNNINDAAGFTSLNNRLKLLSLHCIDILNDR